MKRIGGMSRQAPTEQHAENGYETPRWLVARIRDDVFGGTIALDPCTTALNPTGARFWIAPPDDGILLPWDYSNVYVNPPYGRTIKHWVSKSIAHPGAVVMLVPARTCSTWFHNLLANADEMLLFRGRIKFMNGAGAPFPSALFALRCSLVAVADLGHCFNLRGSPVYMDGVRSIGTAAHAETLEGAA